MTPSQPKSGEMSDSKADSKAFLSEGRSSSEDLPPALLEFVARLQAFADNEYVRGCHVSRRTECLGYEAKIKQGKFGEAEYQAHKEMDMHMGAHFGIYKAIAAARAAIALATIPKETT